MRAICSETGSHLMVTIAFNARCVMAVVQVVVLGVRPAVPPDMPEDYELLMCRWVDGDELMGASLCHTRHVGAINGNSELLAAVLFKG